MTQPTKTTTIARKTDIRSQTEKRKKKRRRREEEGKRRRRKKKKKRNTYACDSYRAFVT